MQDTNKNICRLIVSTFFSVVSLLLVVAGMMLVIETGWSLTLKGILMGAVAIHSGFLVLVVIALYNDYHVWITCLPYLETTYGVIISLIGIFLILDLGAMIYIWMASIEVHLLLPIAFGFGVVLLFIGAVYMGISLPLLSLYDQRGNSPSALRYISVFNPTYAYYPTYS